jgi:predicted N-acetyltransferase YhbS
MKILIRPEQPSDTDEIYELNKTAFGQDNEARLVDLIRKGQGFIPELSLVAISENKIIGYILFSKVFIVNGDNRHETLALAPMAVNPKWQKQGIGAKLITQGLQAAKDLGYTSAIVLGHELYYPRFGFLPATKWNIKAPIDLPANVFMAIELVPNGLANISGTVEYPVEFSTI